MTNSSLYTWHESKRPWANCRIHRHLPIPTPHSEVGLAPQTSCRVRCKWRQARVASKTQDCHWRSCCRKKLTGKSRRISGWGSKSADWWVWSRSKLSCWAGSSLRLRETCLLVVRRLSEPRVLLTCLKMPCEPSSLSCLHILFRGGESLLLGGFFVFFLLKLPLLRFAIFSISIFFLFSSLGPDEGVSWVFVLFVFPSGPAFI